MPSNARTINTIMAGDASGLIKASADGQQSLKNLSKTAHETSKSMAESAKMRASFASRVKAFTQGGEEAAALKSVGRLLKGGGAFAGIKIMAGELANFATGAREAANGFRTGKMTGAEAADHLAGSLPIIGEVWKAGRGIHAAFEDGAAAIAKWAGASEETVYALESGETALKEQQERYEAISQIIAMTRAGMDKKALFSLPTDQREAFSELERYKNTVGEIRTKFSTALESRGGTATSADMKSLNLILEGEAKEHAEKMRAIQGQQSEQMAAFALSSDRRVESIRFASRQRQLTTTGGTLQAEREQTQREYRLAVEDATKLASEMTKSQPSRAADIFAGLNREVTALRQNMQSKLALPDSMIQLQATMKSMETQARQTNLAYSYLRTPAGDGMNLGQIQELITLREKLKDGGASNGMVKAAEGMYRWISRIGEENQKLQSVRDTLKGIADGAAKAGMTSGQASLYDLRKNNASPSAMAGAAWGLEMTRLRAAARDTFESTRTPMEKLKTQLDDLKAQFAIGAIDKTTFQRATMRAGVDADSAMGLGGTPHGVPDLNVEHTFTTPAERRFASPGADAAKTAVDEAKKQSNYWQQFLAIARNPTRFNIVSIDKLF